MTPKSLRNRLLKQVLIAIIGFDFTCGSRRGHVSVLVLLLRREGEIIQNWPQPTQEID